MKKVFIVIGILGIATTGFAQFFNYPQGTHYVQVHDIIMSGFERFTIAVEIALVVCAIIIAKKIKVISKKLEEKFVENESEPHKRTLTYLVAIGDVNAANKEALKRLVDALYPLYYSSSVSNKEEAMDKLIENNLPRMEKLGLNLPHYVHSGKNFIDYMNSLTGNSVKY